MDAQLVALATSGAQALVGLMATDVWGKAKGLAARLFRSAHDQELQEVSDELEASRSIVLAADPQTRQRQLDLWESRMHLRLLEDPQSETLIRELQELDQRELGTSNAVGKVVMNATAHDSGRVYQQGQGVQHNG